MPPAYDMPDDRKTDQPIRIGISACLLGCDCRYDGKHKRDRLLCDTLGKHFQWVPICPEVELGLPTPRPRLQLEWRDGQVRMIMPAEEKDLTETMTAYARRRVAALAEQRICGCVLKSNSPSCGIRDVPVCGNAPDTRRAGRGLFAEAIVAQMPNLPLEDERRLQDTRLRENWVARVLAYAH